MKRLILLCLLFPTIVNAQWLSPREWLAFQEDTNTVSNPVVTDAWAWWTMEGSGTDTWPDATGNGRTLAESTVEVASTNAYIGNGAIFVDTSATYLERADTALLSPISHSMTFVGWCSVFDTNNTENIFSKDRNVNGEREYLLQWSATRNTFVFNVITNGATSTFQGAETNGIIPGAFYFFACVIDFEEQKHRICYGYTNGTPTLTPFYDSSVWGGFGPDGQGTNTSQNFRVGNRTNPSSEPHNGVVDELGLYTRELSRTEVEYIWNSGAGRTYSGL